MAQGPSKRSVTIDGQPVLVDDVEIKEILIEILEAIRELRDLTELIHGSEGS